MSYKKEDCTELENFYQLYPTHHMPEEFWEHLGRAIATFGFLEYILKQAILLLTGEKKINPDNTIEEVYKWGEQLEKTFVSQLYNLIGEYKDAFKNFHIDHKENFEKLIHDLYESVAFRNILCHACWVNRPDSDGKSVPLFVNKTKNGIKLFTTPVDINYLRQIQKATKEMAMEVYFSVTRLGLHFPNLKDNSSTPTP